MRIRVFTERRSLALKVDSRAAKLLDTEAVAGIKNLEAKAGDLSYLDLSGLEPPEQRRRVALLKERSGRAAWGVLDPKGRCPDPAALFHLGAADYLGPEACRKGLTKARIKAALAFHGDDPADSGLDPKARPDEYPFPGWRALRRGEPSPFYFLYFGLEGSGGLKGKMGEAAYAAFRSRLHAFLSQGLAESEALLWIENEGSGVFLIPPSRSKAEAAVSFCLRCLANAPIVGYEKLRLGLPLRLVFALHFGSCPFEAPGRTGTIVSEDMNFIFHLGAKRAEPNRITLSEAARRAVPDRLPGLFAAAGCFEGRELLRSRLFLRLPAEGPLAGC